LSERIQLREAIANEVIIVATTDNQTGLDKDFIFIQNHTLNHRKYLNPTYSIGNLASETKISSRNVSQILRKNTNYNFTGSINELRVQKVKKILTDPEYSAYTIVSIGLECGFYSKSTFYRAF
jgi:AraC-like DNA-binding protein